MDDNQIIFQNVSSQDQRIISLTAIIIQSVCVNCQETGKTNLLLRKIPFFKQIILISFYCQQCGFKNNEVQFGGKLAQKGVNISFKLVDLQSLNRQFIRSGFATIKIPQLQFQIPPNSKGEINTIQGLFYNCIENLEKDLTVLKHLDKQSAQKIEAFIQKLKEYVQGIHFPFKFILEDPSGNSCIKNIYIPKCDPNIFISYYDRSLQQIKQMGYSPQNAQSQFSSHKLNMEKPFDEQNLLKMQSIKFGVNCNVCGMQGETKMCETSIPYFKDVIIMSFVCEQCGANSKEMKVAGQIGQRGRRIILFNVNEEDMRRQLFKVKQSNQSQYCGVIIPQLELELVYGTLGACYTTIQGLLNKIYDHLMEVNNYFDSDKEMAVKIKNFFQKFRLCLDLKMKFKIILDDPASHSFLQNPRYPQSDSNVMVEEYVRNEQHEQLMGLTNMKVQNYK